MLFLKSSPSKLVSVTSGENRFLRLNNCVEYATGYHGCVRAAVCSWRWGSNHIDMLGSIPKMDFDCCDSTKKRYFNDGLQSRIFLHNIDYPEHILLSG